MAGFDTLSHGNSLASCRRRLRPIAHNVYYGKSRRKLFRWLKKKNAAPLPREWTWARNRSTAFRVETLLSCHQTDNRGTNFF
jgi:hypothetical protein